MLGKLTEIQMSEILERQAVGRIGYRDATTSYITPVTYAYDGKYIYGQSNDGMKLHAMRDNPYICFEVDEVFDIANWQSVVLWGHFEELKEKEADNARLFLYSKILDLMTDPLIITPPHNPPHLMDDSYRIKQNMYRIKISEKSGRFEKRE
jgi:uncharacterized protein